MGYYLNTTDDTTDEIIPQLSPISLLMYALENSDPIATSIINLLGEEHNFHYMVSFFYIF
jgi:hypothetical protein